MTDTQKKYNGREGSLYSAMNYNNIILKTEIIRLKLINNHVTEFLTYNLYETTK